MRAEVSKQWSHRAIPTSEEMPISRVIVTITRKEAPISECPSYV